MALLRAQLLSTSVTSGVTPRDNSNGSGITHLSPGSLTELLDLRQKVRESEMKLLGAQTAFEHASERELTAVLASSTLKQRCAQLAALAESSVTAVTVTGDIRSANAVLPDWAVALLAEARGECVHIY